MLKVRDWSLRDWSFTAAAAKSLQSWPTLCDPIDGNPPGSPVPGILQARTLEWVAISFSNAWKWKVKVKSPSRVRLLATPWTAAYQAPPSMGFSRQEYSSGLPLPSPLILHYLITIPFSFIISHSPKWIPYFNHISPHGECGLLGKPACVCERKEGRERRVCQAMKEGRGR